MNSCTINFKFEEVNGSFMSCIVNGEDVIIDNDGNASITIPLSLPDTVKLEFSGKGSNDTIIDEDGNLLSDKCVKILGIKLDYFDLNDIYLYQHIHLIDETGRSHEGSYIGFNGTMILEFNESNIFKQYIVCNNKIKKV